MLGKRMAVENNRGDTRNGTPHANETNSTEPARSEPRGVPGTTRSYGGRPETMPAAAPSPATPVMREPGRVPGGFPQFRPAQGEVPPAAAEGEGKRLMVGRHIVLSGEIRTCDRLVVEGCVEASLFDTRVVEIAPGGVFRGSASIESAEIGGLFEGDLVVRERLLLKGTGRIVGNVQYGELEIERGGVVSGRLDALAPDADRAQPAAAPAPRPAEEKARLSERGPAERGPGERGNGAATHAREAG